MPSVKTESGRKALNRGDPIIKVESDVAGATPETLSDGDVYEDAGDLDFARAEQGLYLTRIPISLWESWSNIDDDQEIQLGIIRVEGALNDIKRMSLMLSSDSAKNDIVPKEYNLNITTRNSANTFIFTEKDLPGYNSKVKGSSKQEQNGGGPPRPLFQDRSRQGLQRIDKNKRWSPRKAIPKQTALAGQIQLEMNCLPVENEEYRKVMSEKILQASTPKLTTTLIDLVGPNSLAPGTLGTAGNFTKFIKNTAPTRAKPQEFKAARKAQNELLDEIVDCFKEYEFWPLKALKERTKQPEAYLKQTLEMVAYLVRSGPHAATWHLRSDSTMKGQDDIQSSGQVKDEGATDGGDNLDGLSDNGASDEDEENIDMEDVLQR